MSANRDNSTRTKARKRALDILYEAELRETGPADTLADRVAAAQPPVRPFTIELVTGVAERAAELDAVLAAALSEGWTIARMPAVDRNLARIAIFELAHTDTPTRVVVNEAVDLAAEFSTENSPAFLNAVLDAAATRLAASAPDTPPQP